MRTQHHQKPPPPPAQNPTPAKLDTKPAKSMFASNKPAAKPVSKSTTISAKSTPDSSQASTQSSAKPAATKAAPLKREGSSLFKAFAKARPKAQSQATEDSAEPSPGVDSKATEDGQNNPEPELTQELTTTVDAMHGLSDEEADDEDTAMLDDGAITETGGKSKKEREDELRRMMDMEGKNHSISVHVFTQRLTHCRPDEPMVDAPTKTATEEAAEDAEDEPDSKAEAQTRPEPEETITVSDGRRRGRRRVMKKKTVKDEEGYLGVFEHPRWKFDHELTTFTVTREEAAWESFSEEEPVPKKAKVSVAPTTAKTKKAAPKGQGNIMSFFSKK
jgi:DNA polymerase delta subunit 3